MSFTQSSSFPGRRAVDVHRQYMTALQWFQREWGSGGDDLPVVDNVVDMWLSYPHWEIAPELFGVVKSYLVTVIDSAYECEFVDPVSTALTHDVKLSSMHFVRSWFTDEEGSRRRGFSNELASACDSAKLLSVRLNNVDQASPWSSLLRRNRELLQQSFLSTPSAEYVENPVVGTYDADWMLRLEELGPEVGGSPPSRRTRGKKVKPVTSSDVVIKKNPGRK